ncbi:acyl-CoA thioesterase [Planococcus sp. 1R117A]|uniref:acyl-CoA thioesterase n=1 Tax=Planococcus sp. 1R117A TaxID=3447020 RepID=UPI003EDC953D
MFTKKIRIQFVDTDASKRIHYSAVFRYFETLDHEFFRSIGCSYKDLFETGYEMPRVHLDCTYLGSVEYDDELEACVSVAKIGNSSFTYSFNFYKAGQVVIKGSLTVVFITSADGKKVTIPPFIKEELEKHLDKSAVT